MHGELLSAWCVACDARHRWSAPLLDSPACPNCGEAALRPDVIWFGELPYGLAEIESALAGADLFVSVGTSGAVAPAAGFVRISAAYGASTLELNLEPSQGAVFFDEARHGPAGVLVPAWVDDILREQGAHPQ